jgi:hypothetical protein
MLAFSAAQLRLSNMGTLATDNPAQSILRMFHKNHNRLSLICTLAVDYGADNIQVNMRRSGFVDADLVSHIRRVSLSNVESRRRCATMRLQWGCTDGSLLCVRPAKLGGEHGNYRYCRACIVSLERSRSWFPGNTE